MRTIVFNLLIAILASCATDCDQGDSNYLIEVNFSTGKVKDSGKELQNVTGDISEICKNVIWNKDIPTKYTASKLCYGSDGIKTNYTFIELKGPYKTEVYLAVYNDNDILVRKPNEYRQEDCSKRFIFSY